MSRILDFWEGIVTGIRASRLVQLMLAGLLLRLLFMPFFGHNDILSEARRIYYWSENSIYFDAIARNATNLFQLLFFKIFGWLIPNKDLLFSHADMMNTTASPTDYFAFVSSEYAQRAIFIIKLPFLVADMMVAWCIYAFLGKREGALRSVGFWLFNPITIFAIYIFGRFEAIPIMFLALGLLALKNNKLIWAALLVGLSVNSRELFIFLGPVFAALVLSPSAASFGWFKRVCALAIIAVAVMIAVQIISFTVGDTTPFGATGGSIADESRVDFLFQFMIGSWFMFPMALFVILLYTWNSNGGIANKALFVFAAVFAVFFSLTSHTAHYTSWLVLFPVIFIGYDKALIKPFVLLCISWFFYHMAITDKGVFTAWLASPWTINNAGLPSFPWLYDASGLDGTMPLIQFARTFRTFFAASTLYLFVQMFIIYWKRRQLEAAHV